MTLTGRHTRVQLNADQTSRNSSVVYCHFFFLSCTDDVFYSALIRKEDTDLLLFLYMYIYIYSLYWFDCILLYTDQIFLIIQKKTVFREQNASWSSFCCLSLSGSFVGEIQVCIKEISLLFCSTFT